MNEKRSFVGTHVSFHTHTLVQPFHSKNLVELAPRNEKCRPCVARHPHGEAWSLRNPAGFATRSQPRLSTSHSRTLLHLNADYPIILLIHTSERLNVCVLVL